MVQKICHVCPDSGERRRRRFNAQKMAKKNILRGEMPLQPKKKVEGWALAWLEGTGPHPLAAHPCSRRGRGAVMTQRGSRNGDTPPLDNEGGERGTGAEQRRSRREPWPLALTADDLSRNLTPSWSIRQYLQADSSWRQEQQHPFQDIPRRGCAVQRFGLRGAQQQLCAQTSSSLWD